jgi:3-isopropylmalate/(R)-2-methylmalate dehydratase small subunit
MKPFTTLTSIAAPLRMMNIDTDVIIPKQFLKTIARTGLGKSAFFDLRYHDDGSIKADFVLNKPDYAGAEILITGSNFGCGSSREHAPWAILDMGFRCVIASSFADIFYNNCFKNGILPVILPQDDIDQLMASAENEPDAPLEIDLDKQTVTRGNQFSFTFEIDSFRKHCLINGLDDIGITLEKAAAIDSFEAVDKEKRSWV